MMKIEYCPCGSNQPYDDCCGLFITGRQVAPTPEALMRSRYTAYATAHIDYIAKTMRSPAADGFNADEALAWSKQAVWRGLRVLHAKIINADTGTVEFIASYKLNGKMHKIHEISEFHRMDGCWYYIAEILDPADKPRDDES